MKKVLYTIGLALLAVGCTDDYKDWANPFKNDPEAAKSMTMSINPVGTIDLATVSTETIQIFSPVITIEDEAETTYQAVIYGPESDNKAEFNVDAKGNVPTEVLETAVNALYGQRPVLRTIPMDVSGYVKVGGQTFKATGNTTLSVIPNAPEIDAAYYLTGSLNGWDNTDKTYKLTNDGSDPYENPIFTCRIPAPDDGSNVEFKMTPESGIGGDWSKCLAAGSTPGTFVYNNDGGNFVIEAVAGAKFYDITFNMMELTWSYKAISFTDYIYLACDFNGWSTDASPLIHLGDGRYEGFYYIQEADESTTWGFKFVIDGSWSGGDHTKATSGTYELGGGNNLNCPTGFYQVQVNQADATWTLTEVNTISLIGSAVNGDSSWGTDADMTFSTTEKCWIYEGPLTAGEFKFRMNHDWSISWGGTGMDNLTNINGANLQMSAAGNYKVTFKPNCNGQGIYTVTPAN